MQRAIRINFDFAVLFSVIGGMLILFKPDLIFPEIMQIYGPLIRNLRLIGFYLVASQSLLWAFRYRRNGYLEALFMGGLLLLVAVGIPFYSKVNELPVSYSFILGLAYCGLSQIMYFAAAYMRLPPQAGGRRS